MPWWSHSCPKLPCQFWHGARQLLLALLRLPDDGTYLGGALLAKNHLADFGTVLGSFLLALLPLTC